jgi:hypothetical protein
MDIGYSFIEAIGGNYSLLVPILLVAINAY